jgi:translation initiation factor IF-1
MFNKERDIAQIQIQNDDVVIVDLAEVQALRA